MSSRTSAYSYFDASFRILKTHGPMLGTSFLVMLLRSPFMSPHHGLDGGCEDTQGKLVSSPFVFSSSRILWASFCVLNSSLHWKAQPHPPPYLPCLPSEEWGGGNIYLGTELLDYRVTSMCNSTEYRQITVPKGDTVHTPISNA